MVSSVQDDIWKKIQENQTFDLELQILIGSLKLTLQKHYTWMDDQLRRKGRLVNGNDEELRAKIINLWNFTPTWGYSSIDATRRRLLAYFYWNGIRTNILNFVYKYSICQRNKYDTATSSGLLQTLPIPALYWTDININFIERLLK